MFVQTAHPGGKTGTPCHSAHNQDFFGHIFPLVLQAQCNKSGPGIPASLYVFPGFLTFPDIDNDAVNVDKLRTFLECPVLKSFFMRKPPWILSKALSTGNPVWAGTAAETLCRRFASIIVV
jgi:hypothetical protein